MLRRVEDELHHTIARRLGEDGQRYTGSRRELIDVLVAEGQPMTIPEILARSAGLAQSSVYRNLTALEKAGAVTKVVTDGEWGRYELAHDLTGHHHHVICTGCGLVRDVELPKSLERAIAGAMQSLGTELGFVIEEHRLDLVGRCGECT